MIAEALLACAMNVHPITMDKIVQVESGGNPYAVNVNRLQGMQPQPKSAAEAAAVARRYMALGYQVDIGLAQVTDRNLPGLGLTIEQALEPCANIKAGGRIITDCYRRASALFGEGQTALRAGLRCYNTGTFTRGAAYEARYFGPQPVPAFAGSPAPLLARSERPNPYTASMMVDQREAWNVRVFQ